MKPVISAICPVRNESQNIPLIFKSFKPLGASTELIFVESNSTDSTWNQIKNLNRKKNRFGVVFRAAKIKDQGKAQAVATGFDLARGKYLIIVDADLSVNHTDLMLILKLFSTDKDQIIASGNRLRGFSKPRAFYWLNYIGNYFFRYYFSLILGIPVLDISCGSKALTKPVWNRIRKLRQSHGRLDSWGDLDWLYYGVMSGCRLVFVDIDYRPRYYGQSKLSSDFRVLFKYALNICFIGLKILFQH